MSLLRPAVLLVQLQVDRGRWIETKGGWVRLKGDIGGASAANSTLPNLFCPSQSHSDLQGYFGGWWQGATCHLQQQPSCMEQWVVPCIKHAALLEYKFWQHSWPHDWPVIVAKEQLVLSGLNEQHLSTFALK